MKKKIVIIASAVLLLLCVFGIAVTVRAVSGVEPGTICDGVFVDSIEIGGMTVEEAKQAVDAYIKDRQDTILTLNIEGRGSIQTTLGDLGYGADTADTFLEEAEAVGKTGNLIQRYKDLKDVEVNNLQYTLEFSINKKAVKKLLKAEGVQYDIEAKNASLTRTNGKFVITPHVNGRKLDINNTMDLIVDAVMNNWDYKSDITLDAVVEDAIAEYTAEDMEKCNTVLGSYKTSYASSNANRSQNLANGSKLINGAVIYPGETFSVNKATSPFNAANGYAQAGAYEQGKVIQSYGGGICQVSSTLYNAVLYAELDVVERSSHSMTVTYASLSRDAAIAGDYKDLKFRNNTDYPIYIESHTQNKEIYFNIYGNETRDLSRRKIDFEYEILETRQPDKEVVTEDPTQPASYRKVTQEQFVGYTTQLFKVVYMDGKQVERTKLNTSYYQSAPRYVTVGSKEEPEEEVPEEEPEGPEGDAGGDTGKPSSKPSDKTTGKETDKNTDKSSDKTTDKNTDKDVKKDTEKDTAKDSDKKSDKADSQDTGKDVSKSDTGADSSTEEETLDGAEG